jgi:NhaA family Na+:H+ antiporter
VLEVGAFADLILDGRAGGRAGSAGGKPLGITLLCWLGVRPARRAPGRVGWAALLGAGILGGIGFTMALFITSLAFPNEALAAASKLGVITASVAAAILGLACLARALPRSA